MRDYVTIKITANMKLLGPKPALFSCVVADLAEFDSDNAQHDMGIRPQRQTQLDKS